MKANLNWRGALTFMTADPRWKWKLFLGGALFFPLFPLGWVLALGFRSLTGPRLVEGHSPVLPDWSENMAIIFVRGMKAIGVILAHFSPFLLLFWMLGVSDISDLIQHWKLIVFFFVAIAVFPPLFLPLLPLAYAHRLPWLTFSVPEEIVLSILFLGAVLILPASFVQVGLYGSYSAAFRARSAWRFAIINRRNYLEAWVASLAVSAAAVLMGPFMPWGLFWSYLVILHLFLEALQLSDTPEVRSRFRQSVLLRAPDKTSV
jgi:hypothetical protein